MPTRKVSTLLVNLGSEVSDPVEVRVERMSRMRTMRLTVSDAGKVVLRTASHVGKNDLLQFLINNRQWLLQTLSTVSNKPGLLEHLQKSPFLVRQGASVRVEFEASYRYSLRFIGGNAADGAGEQFHLRYKEDDADREKNLKNLLQALAKVDLPPRVAHWAAIHKLKVRNVSVRDQRSRWGSCSSSGMLSLNWRLILLQPELQDYIILHELAHLTHLNHSDAFWVLVERYDPQWREHDSLITSQGSTIMQLGRLI